MKPLNLNRAVYQCLMLILALALWPAAATHGAEGADLARARFPRLARGINVSWLGYYVAQEKFELDRERALRDVRAIKATGCTHVRLVLNIDNLRGGAGREQAAPKNLARLDEAIKLVLDEGLAVIVDPFHYGAKGLIEFPGPNDPEAEVMVKFWGALAGHLAATDPERVFLEVANEPGLANPQDWYTVEIRIMKAIRAAAPRHTIIAGYNQRASKDEWDAIKGLTLFPPVEDKNVIYNFHDYEPMEITHQGASWAWKYGQLSGVPYPVTAENIQPVLAKTTDKSLLWNLNKLGKDPWNREKIESRIGMVAAWAKQRGVVVTCNEFGVYDRVASPEARAAWTRDMREVLEKHGIGWTIWEEQFGIMQHKGGRLVMDEPILKALGLNVPKVD
jgi:aryl-phospho-beta-D-glucosidase BglC (GH1 family)